VMTPCCVLVMATTIKTRRRSDPCRWLAGAGSAAAQSRRTV
jgi:hypothetical protein